MQSNPIQQRIEALEDKWINDISSLRNKKMLVIRTTEEDSEMTETFYDYLLGLDNDIIDIAIQFHTPLSQISNYSNELLVELEDMIQIWNTAHKDKAIEDVHIDWEIEQVNDNKNEKPKLFIQNLNNLCTSLNLEESQFLVPILYFHSTKDNLVIKWLNSILEEEFNPHLRFLVHDTYENPRFTSLINKHHDQALLIEPHFDLPSAIEQIAAMGDPKAPDTKYRFFFTKMLNAIGKRENSSVNENAKKCLEIAEKMQLTDPYWHTQIMAIYFSLASHEIGNKAYSKSITQANKALSGVRNAVGKIPDEMTFRLIGQCLMLRGSLHQQINKTNKALADFLEAESYYEACDDIILQIEALRMAAFCAKKCGDNKSRVNALVKGTLLGKNINQDLALASSYALLVKDLLNVNQNKIQIDELEEIMVPLFGVKWQEHINRAGTLVELED